MEQLELERSTAREMVVAGSMAAGIALFVASITIMLAVALLLGVLVLVERAAISSHLHHYRSQYFLAG